MKYLALAAIVTAHALSLTQSHLAFRAVTYGAMLEAMDFPSPIGGGEELAVLYLRQPVQNSSSLEAAQDFIPKSSPISSKLYYLMAYHDRAWCPTAKIAAPNRGDIKALCEIP